MHVYKGGERERESGAPTQGWRGGAEVERERDQEGVKKIEWEKKG